MTAPQGTTGYLVAVDVLREYANALRGDWSDIDGRSERLTINEIADTIVAAVDGGQPVDVERLRLSAGVCLRGGGHWDGYCQPGVDGYCAPPPEGWTEHARRNFMPPGKPSTSGGAR